ncbi:hypothetical protein ANAPRD1_00181 [Anaplasma phagocytophilum]|uniref:hypothetical protein n=1 Tax=Anaplasma phagocytophilum TaxID=948 RepID=UPI0007E1ADA1|nr:hypothetical protein [Anaplasma phagocytophilum]SCV62296.1 hypothetical protein ANAPRD1_00181 [Anaplasma phagocytophilum]SCV62343.1 hypothetical protein ANAPH1_00197 [Anaplasma phagocytophilum]
MANGVLCCAMIGGFFHEWCYLTVVMAGGDSGIYRGRRVRCLMAGMACSFALLLSAGVELYWC